MIKQIAAMILLALTVSGCSSDSDSLTPAPLGDRAVLEALAESFTEISDEQLSISPMSLPGDDRKKFVTKVFAANGYSYSATLTALANNLDKGNQLHRDMAELVLLPHRHPKYPMDPAKIYSSEELQAVAVIERMLNM